MFFPHIYKSKTFVFILFTFFGLSAEAQTTVLPSAVSIALKEAGIPTRSVAILVQGVDAERPKLQINAQQAMNPASVMKLVTTYAALELLGPAHTWRTEALADNLPSAGQLKGNLYLRGSGDPKLSLEQFWLLLRQLRTRGVTDIDGDLVLDRSAFSLPPYDPAAFDNEALRPYNVGPDALLINLQSLRFTLQADAAQKSVQIVSETPSEGLRITNRLTLSTESCDDWREQIKPSVSRTNIGSIEFAGSFPIACGEKALHLAPWPANQQVDALFRALWRELGGTLRGQVRSGVTSATAQSIAAQDSPSLSEIVRDINKYSNNVMARQLFLSLSAERPATLDAARQRITVWLNDKGLKLPELVIENGAGLSRSERISAKGLAQLLHAAWQSTAMPELMSSLPLAGVDGTLKKRFGDSAVNGRAHLKTGYLENVRAIAGYVLDTRGKRWVVVCLINDPRAKFGKPAMDALVRWVVNDSSVLLR